LENNPAEAASSSPNATKPKNRRALLIIIAAIVAVGLVAGAFIASGLLSKPTAEDSWLFKGAYAEYEGSTSVLGFGFDFSVKLEVLDHNSTHAYLSTSFRMQSSLGEAAEEENATWVELSQIGFSNAFTESNVTRSYDATLDFGDLGKRTCTVYEFATDGPTMTIYVDKEIGWPLKMKATMTGENSVSLSLDINLVDTNIPALK
jgi:flagellar basal body-associated protein FliL